jgi:hypothetical protein
MAIADQSQESLVTSRDWFDIPWFRKPIGLAILFLVFTPGYLLLIWTGDTYHRKNGVVYRTGLKMKQRMTLVVVLLIVSYLLRSYR